MARRTSYKPHPDPEKARRGEKVMAVFLDFKVIEEGWNVYELEDGTRVRVKIHATQFDRAIDPETDELIYDKEGKPQYGVGLGVETVFEFPEGFIKNPADRRES